MSSVRTTEAQVEKCPSVEVLLDRLDRQLVDARRVIDRTQNDLVSFEAATKRLNLTIGRMERAIDRIDALFESSRHNEKR